MQDVQGENQLDESPGGCSKNEPLRQRKVFDRVPKAGEVKAREYDNDYRMN